ncbi:hypothetical protein B0H16DRAFT_1729549 [Mycena metata]|uniref:Uncharacterized protein n=1 Tax=Mycena metata TaxID=1033252 RepID=A0AAD7ICT4_9AGAR|nr:hypothetical protein B0H16DRAFT_1729549 [Mycena metata]
MSYQQAYCEILAEFDNAWDAAFGKTPVRTLPPHTSLKRPLSSRRAGPAGGSHAQNLEEFDGAWTEVFGDENPEGRTEDGDERAPMALRVEEGVGKDTQHQDVMLFCVSPDKVWYGRACQEDLPDGFILHDKEPHSDIIVWSIDENTAEVGTIAHLPEGMVLTIEEPAARTHSSLGSLVTSLIDTAAPGLVARIPLGTPLNGPSFDIDLPVVVPPVITLDHPNLLGDGNISMAPAQG